MSHHVYRVHKKQGKRGLFFDRYMYVIGLLGPIMTVPQVIEVLVHRNVAGISIPTWGTFVFLSIMWFIYGIIHNERPIYIPNFIYLFLNLAIVAGTIYYRGSI